jgi:hypothetical protein
MTNKCFALTKRKLAVTKRQLASIKGQPALTEKIKKRKGRRLYRKAVPLPPKLQENSLTGKKEHRPEKT